METVGAEAGMDWMREKRADSRREEDIGEGRHEEERGDARLLGKRGDSPSEEERGPAFDKTKRARQLFLREEERAT